MKLASHIGVRRKVELRRPSRGQRMDNINKMPRILIFLSDNKIGSLAELDGKLSALQHRCPICSSRLTDVTKRRDNFRNCTMPPRSVS